MADLEAAVRKNPTAENYFSLGEAWRKIGRKDKAAAAYRKAIELRPGYAEAMKALAGLKE
jgi:cytochrome c-type biogenesis protein CcmH/NrfG